MGDDGHGQAGAGWRVGWSLGAAVVAVAAGLLLAVIGLARRISRQAGEIEAAIAGAQEHTRPLYDIAHVNRNLDRIARSLKETA